MNLLLSLLLLFTLQANASSLLPELTQELSSLEIAHNDYVKDLQALYNPTATQIKYLNNVNFTLNIISNLNNLQPDPIIDRIITNYSAQIKLNKELINILYLQIAGNQLTFFQEGKLKLISYQQSQLDEDLLSIVKDILTEELSPADKKLIVKKLKTIFGLKLFDDNRNVIVIANYIINKLK